MLFSFKSKFDQAREDLKSLSLQNYVPVWEPFMKKHHCSQVCEVGIYKGDNFMSLTAHKPRLAVAVPARQDVDSNTYFKGLVYGMPFVKILNENTAVASKDFRNNYFDFVYLDGDTAEKSYYQDIVSWYPKVKYGKFLAGHNYVRGRSVAQAVDRFAAEKNLKVIWRTPSIWAVIKS